MMRVSQIATATSACLLGAHLVMAGMAAGSGGAASEGRIQDVRTAPPISSVNGFVENLGQWDPEVLFFAREGGIEATVLRDGVLLVPRAPHWDRELQGPPPPAPAPIVLRWEAGAAPVGQGELATLHHYLLGAKANHVSNARGFASVRFEDVAPGIDLELSERGGFFAYDLHAEPGASVEGFAIEVEGVERWEARAPGVLELHTATGDVIQQRIGPSWQEDPATLTREALAPEFRLLEASAGALRFGFAAPGRDVGRALVIDPTLEWSTFIGGSTGEAFDSKGMAVDESGAAYLLCQTHAGTPTTPGAYQGAVVGGVDAWIGKLSPDGTTLLWATFLGGDMTEKPEGGLAVDQDGSVVVVGSTWSHDFPTTPGSLQTIHAGQEGTSDLFITRLASDGSELVWSTLLGKGDYEIAQAMELFPSGDVLVAADPGQGITPDPPKATPGAYDQIYDPGDKMILRISADGESLVFLTHFPIKTIRGLAIDSNSNIYLGSAWGTGVPPPTTPGVLKEGLPPANTGDGYLAKLNSNGTQLLWGTFLGGDEENEGIKALAVDASFAVYVTGETSSEDFPVTAGAFQTTMSEEDDGFVAKLLPDATGLAWATYLGTSCGSSPPCGGIVMSSLAVDQAGAVFVSGTSNEFFFTTTPDAFQPDYLGFHPSSDALFAKVDPFGERLLYGTWFGGSSGEVRPAIKLTGKGSAYLGLQTNSSTLPVTSGSYSPTYNGFGDLGLAKFSFPPPTTKIRKAWNGGKSVLVAGPPPPAPVSSDADGSDTDGALRLSLRGAPALQPGWIVVRRGVLPEEETLIRVPDARVPVATDEHGALDVIFDRPDLSVDSALAFQAWIHDPASSARWEISNALEHHQVETAPH